MPARGIRSVPRFGWLPERPCSGGKCSRRAGRLPANPSRSSGCESRAKCAPQAARCCGKIFLLEPAKRPLAVTARMREYSYVASLYVCQDGRPAAFWRALEDVLNAAAAAQTRLGETMWGASTLASDGVMVRGLSTSNRFIPGALTNFWRLARRAVTGEDPIPPRKIY